jgi:hypothetical protein
MIRFLLAMCIAVGLVSTQASRADENAYQRVSFYFAAHEDDWQLFMSPSAFEDVISAQNKVVFIYTTAGDAGLGAGAGGRKHPFYLARENGAEAAVRFMADTDFPTEKSVSMTLVNGHAIRRVAYRNTVSYFLRGPDGNPEGTGYAGTGFQSLKRLAAGQLGTFAAVDGSTVYHGWSDLVATLRAIVDQERGRAPSVQVHVAETDVRVNAGDHADHIATAKAALEAMQPLDCATRVFYVDYASEKLPENLAPQQRDRQSSVFAVTASAIRDLDHFNSWRHYREAYVGRNYFRLAKGSGTCGATPLMPGDMRATVGPAPSAGKPIQQSSR